MSLLPGESVFITPGDSVGPYVVEQPLGRGGAGDVWLAHDQEGRQVALKILRPGAIDVDAASGERFEREGDMLQRLDHPNIVGLRGRGMDPGLGRPWLAMEYVPGRDLSTVLRERSGARLPVSEALFVLEGCAKALEAAHAQGIIHRDVKPGNVLLTRDGQVKLTDFGIALSSDATSRLTQRGEVVGTPTYVAPEVLSRGEWGPPADMYALGVLAYRVLTGSAPFPHKDLTRLIAAHLREPPPPLAERATGLAPALAALFERLLAKEPAARPGAALFLRELSRITRDEDTRRIPARLLEDARREGAQRPGSDEAAVPLPPVPPSRRVPRPAPEPPPAPPEQEEAEGEAPRGVPRAVWALVLTSLALAAAALLWAALRAST